jgi:phosphoglycolate phosphatase
VLNELEVCLFDLDGCLVDSSRPIVAAMNAALATSNLTPIDETEMLPYVGPPLLGSVATILRDRGADPSRATKVVDEYRAAYEAIAVATAATYPGVPQLLDLLSGRVRLAVVTSKPEVFARPVMDRLNFTGYFEFVEGAGLAETEQKSETLARALRRLRGDVEARHTAMIGDRRFDIEAALANGIPSVGVTWGFGTREELEQAGATLIVNDPSELAEAIVEDRRTETRPH